MGGSSSKGKGGYSLEDFCAGGGKWSSGETVILESGENEVNSSCVPCTIDTLTLFCPEWVQGEEGWTGLEVSHAIAWILVILLAGSIVKMWGEHQLGQSIS